MRTPKPYYFKNGVVEFYVKNKVIYYNVKKWSEDGLTQCLYKTGKYDGNIDGLIESITKDNVITGKTV